MQKVSVTDTLGKFEGTSRQSLVGHYRLLNNMEMKIRLILTLFVFIPLLSHGQTTEDVIQKIRDRYYRINGKGVTLVKQSFQMTNYYLENDKLSIAKKVIDNGKYEYYFNYRNGEYNTYFIYFEPNTNSLPQLRAYYNDNNELVLFKEGDKVKTYEQGVINPYYYLKQDACNAINTYTNKLELTRHLNDRRNIEILAEVKNINTTIVQVDTVDYYKHEDGGSGGEFHFFDEKRNLIKISQFDGGEHGGGITNKYFVDDNLIYTTEEKEAWAGVYSSMRANVIFYEKGVPFREDLLDRKGTGKLFTQSNDKYLLEWLEFENVVPKISYKE